MFFLSKPSRDAIQSFISTQKDRPFSYAEVGKSRNGETPSGYTCDHNRLQLGMGREVFDAAVAAVKQWKMFDMPWVQICWPGTPVEEGATVAVLVPHLGFWSLNACRIVYVVEERGLVERFGFAYGTLPEHMAFGEERFSVEYNSKDGSVWYDLLAFSRLGVLARMGYPFTRALQMRFARDSKAAMRRAI